MARVNTHGVAARGWATLRRTVIGSAIGQGSTDRRSGFKSGGAVCPVPNPQVFEFRDFPLGRQDAKFRRIDKYYYERFSQFFAELCGFAGDIPICSEEQLPAFLNRADWGEFGMFDVF